MHRRRSEQNDQSAVTRRRDDGDKRDSSRGRVEGERVERVERSATSSMILGGSKLVI